MTAQTKRIAIAEDCGWSGPFGMYRHISSGKQLLSSGNEVLHGTPPEDKGKPEDERSYKPVPDYLFDLNAMRNAWLHATCNDDRDGTFTSGFDIHLREIVARDNKVSLNWEYLSAYTINASAEQRADAFLYARNLLEDTK